MSRSTTILAGSTGDLGGRISNLLLDEDNSLRLLVREGRRPDKVGVFQERGAEVVEVDFNPGVPRFIPSDFSIDFTECADGHNRNLDLRRKFAPAENDLYPPWQGM